MTQKPINSESSIDQIHEMLREAESKGFTSLSKEEMRQEFKADLCRMLSKADASGDSKLTMADIRQRAVRKIDQDTDGNAGASCTKAN